MLPRSSEPPDKVRHDNIAQITSSCGRGGTSGRELSSNIMPSAPAQSPRGGEVQARMIMELAFIRTVLTHP